MGHGRTDEFRKDAVRKALTRGLTRKQVADDLGVGMSTLNKWITAHRDTDVVSNQDLSRSQGNDRLHRENQRFVRSSAPCSHKRRVDRTARQYPNNGIPISSSGPTDGDPCGLGDPSDARGRRSGRRNDHSIEANGPARHGFPVRPHGTERLALPSSAPSSPNLPLTAGMNQRPTVRSNGHCSTQSALVD